MVDALDAKPRGTTQDAQRVPACPVLAIGVTGHRDVRLEGIDIAALVALIDTTLAQIEQTARALTPDVQLRVVTALADGADSLVADAALRRGWSLASVLPFARSTYAADFVTEQTLATYDRLMAASVSVLELPSDPGVDAAPVAYERAGRIVLAQSDILIAVWDGHPALGRGGTAHIVAEAVTRDIPVIQIDPQAQISPMLLWDGLTDHDLGQQDVETVPRGGLDGLHALIGALILPPADPVSQAMLHQFVRNRPRGTIAALAYPLLLAITGVQRLTWQHMQPPDRIASAQTLRQGFAQVAARVHGFGEQLENVLLPRFVQADAIASQTSRLFRSGYVANFSLSALAVILTLLGLALPPAIKPLLGLLEFVTIATVLWLTHIGNRRGWHRRWLDNRNLAEGLRCQAMAAQIGIGETAARNAADSRPAWVRYWLRQTAREIALPDAVVDRAYLADVRDGLMRMIDAQIAYLAPEAARMHHLEHRLHLIGTALFGITAGACIVATAVELGLHLSHLELSDGATHAFMAIMTMITAGAPALGAAIYGIRMQGEFASVSERAHDTANRLRVLRLTVAEDDLAFDTLQRRIAHLTTLLTSDLSDWHRTHHARPLVLPG